MSVNLLIVDDEQEIRDMLARHYRFQGFEVDTAENGRDALEKLAAKKTDIIISDIRMPVMDGVDLCRRVRAEFPLTRMIMITGYVTLDNALTCLRQGADRCIFKPIEDLGELDRAVQRSVETVAEWVRILTDLSKMRPKQPTSGGSA